MSLARGKFGVEYDPVDRVRDGSSPPFGWIAAVVALLVAASLVPAAVRRFAAPPEEDGTALGGFAPPPATVASDAPGEPAPAAPPPVTAAPAAPPAPPPPPRVEVSNFGNRPQKVKNLLMRLDAARAKGDAELELSTIEQLRALPGDPAADLEGELAARLGELNFTRLFVARSPQWVREVVVKPGESATRIARQHGSTLASLRKLNEPVSVDRIRVGQTLRVMNHPRFILVVHKTLRRADLQLNGKFFKRYALRGETAAAAGFYETTENLRAFLAELGVWFDRADRDELEMLLPKKTPLTVSDS